jgi:hypothetical protein
MSYEEEDTCHYRECFFRIWSISWESCFRICPSVYQTTLHATPPLINVFSDTSPSVFLGAHRGGYMSCEEEDTCHEEEDTCTHS